MNKKNLLLALVVVLATTLVFAHQPTLGNPQTYVSEPEVSKAYYGELDGSPHEYIIESAVPFELYAGVLVPGDVLTHTISADIFKDGELFATLDGENHEWYTWYEEFGGDYYMVGPEYGEDFLSTTTVDPGTYVVKVFNEDNTGKYSVAIGDQEEFPAQVILKTIFILPWIKLTSFGSFEPLNIVLLVLAYMLLLFLIGIVKKNNGLVDIGWGIGFCLIALYTLVHAGTYGPLQLLVTGMTLLWGLRLAGHIYSRTRGKPEDFRYAAWRKAWGKWVHVRAFFQVYMLQGTVMLIVALPIIIVNSYAYTRFNTLTYVGIAIWIVGFFFEAVGDYQLLQHVKRRKGIMKTGLWKYTRHPNYFGEATQWWGLGLIALPIAWPALLSPLLITWLLLRVSGIPMLEKKWDKNKAYQQYKKRTSAFIPWPPK